MDFIVKDVEREKVVSMLKEEQTIRYSKNIQDLYTEQFYNRNNNPEIERVNIEREIQKFILRKNGFTDNYFSLTEYWKIPSFYREDEEVRNSSFYINLNIFEEPALNVGDNMKDISCIHFDTMTPTTLSYLMKPDRPLVILAGSMT